MADVITFPQLESTTERISSFVADSLKRVYVGNTANATTSENGLMSAADKLKLNGIESAAQKNVIELVKVNETALNVTNKGVNIDLSGYVTKESGKGLSTNDFTKAYKDKLDGIASGANSYTLPNATSSTLGGVKIGSNISVSNGTISLSSSNVTSALGYTPPTTNTTYDLSGYVTKESGKGLSTNDFTKAYKDKLDGIASGANSYTLPNATSSTLGGVKIGSNISVSNGTISLSSSNVTSALGYTPPTTNTTYGTGNANTAGLTKLYTSTGTATDGTMTQNAIKTALAGKLDTNGTVASATTAGNVTGTVAIANGGTGATTAAKARENLGISTSGSKCYFGTCSTASATENKVVVCSGFTLETGAMITVNFSNRNTSENITLNVNSTGAIEVVSTYNNTATNSLCEIVNGSFSSAAIEPNIPVDFVYNGSKWVMLRRSTFVTETNLGGLVRNGEMMAINYLRAQSSNAEFFYGCCTTGGSTVAKVVECPEFTSSKLATDFYILVKFNNTNTAKSPTLNVQSTGAKPVHGVHSYSDAGNVKFTANTLCLFRYKAMLDTYHWIKTFDFDCNRSFYATVETAGNDAAKSEIDSKHMRTFTLRMGTRVVINLTEANTATNPTLNLNFTGAKQIYKNGSRLTGSAMKAGLYDLVYDGTYYQVVTMPS